MKVKNKIYFAITVLLFYFGDLITTYFGLQNGGHEANIVMASMEFSGIVIVKTFYILMLLIFILHLEKHKKYSQELGVMIGSVIAFGLFTVLNNMGFYS